MSGKKVTKICDTNTYVKINILSLKVMHDYDTEHLLQSIFLAKYCFLQRI